MRPISPEVRVQILEDPFYEKCIRSEEGMCEGRITWEHTWIYAGRQIDEPWAIVPLCEYHHAVNRFQDCGDLKKWIGQLVALNRATEDDLAKYPKKDWVGELKRLHYEEAQG